MTKTIKKLAGLSITTFFAQFLQLLIFILVSRMLGPLELGVFAVVLVMSNLSVGIFDFGRTTFFTRELAFGRISNQSFWAEIYDRVFFLAGIALVAALCLFVSGHLNWALACLLVVTQYTFQTVQALAKSQIKLGKLSVAIVADRLVCLGAVLVLQFGTMDSVAWVVASWAVGQIAGISLLSIGMKKPRFHFDYSRMKNSLRIRKSIHLGAQSLSSIVVTLDQVILGAISGPAQAGIFAAIAKWFTSFAVLGNSFSTVALNSAANKKKSFIEYVRAEVRPFLLVLSSCLLVVLIAVLYGREIIDFTIGSEFEESAGLLPILSASAAMALVANIASASLQYYGLEKLISKISLLSSSAYVLLLAIALNVCAVPGALILSISQLIFQSCLTLFLFVLGFRAKLKGLI